MTTSAPLSNDIESAIAHFRASTSLVTPGASLLLPEWHEEDWRTLFRFTTTRRILAGDALIRKGEPDRTLYFVLSGKLEVTSRSGDGQTMGRVAQVCAGSVLGELAFFDGGPRSAGAWATTDCDVAAMTPDQFTGFDANHPSLARGLLFALGRILAIRLRNTTARVGR